MREFLRVINSAKCHVREKTPRRGGSGKTREEKPGDQIFCRSQLRTCLGEQPSGQKERNGQSSGGRNELGL